jgi:hypothetical protein
VIAKIRGGGATPLVITKENDIYTTFDAPSFVYTTITISDGITSSLPVTSITSTNFQMNLNTTGYSGFLNYSISPNGSISSSGYASGLTPNRGYNVSLQYKDNYNSTLTTISAELFTRGTKPILVVDGDKAYDILNLKIYVVLNSNYNTLIAWTGDTYEETSSFSNTYTFSTTTRSFTIKTKDNYGAIFINTLNVTDIVTSYWLSSLNANYHSDTTYNDILYVLVGGGSGGGGGSANNDNGKASNGGGGGGAGELKYGKTSSYDKQVQITLAGDASGGLWGDLGRGSPSRGERGHSTILTVNKTISETVVIIASGGYGGYSGQTDIDGGNACKGGNNAAELLGGSSDGSGGSNNRNNIVSIYNGGRGGNNNAHPGGAGGSGFGGGGGGGSAYGNSGGGGGGAGGYGMYEYYSTIGGSGQGDIGGGASGNGVGGGGGGGGGAGIDQNLSGGGAKGRGGYMCYLSYEII